MTRNRQPGDAEPQEGASLEGDNVAHNVVLLMTRG